MYGMGLRHQHFDEITPRLEYNNPSLGVDFFEIITENFLDTKGRPFKILTKIREKFPISFHGVSLSIAADHDLNYEYLNKIKELEQLIQPMLISDHLCWTGTENKNLHNLLPFPYTQVELGKIREKVNRLQDFMKRPMVFENLSAYVQFTNNEMSEAEFFYELHQRTGCQLLLDVNNLYVNEFNFNSSAFQWLDLIPKDAVREIHLAGFSDMGTHYFDTHSKPVHPVVWTYFKKFKDKFSNAITTIEWDEDIPNYDRVLAEVSIARTLGRKNE